MPYSIGEVEELTGIKSHVLRYWEEVMPGLSPKKDAGGRRIYSHRDLDLIQRLKFLIYTKGYTLEGARRQLVQDLNVNDNKAQTLATIRQLKANLNDLYLHLKHSKTTEAQTNDAQQTQR